MLIGCARRRGRRRRVAAMSVVVMLFLLTALLARTSSTSTPFPQDVVFSVWYSQADGRLRDAEYPRSILGSNATRAGGRGGAVLPPVATAGALGREMRGACARPKAARRGGAQRRHSFWIYVESLGDGTEFAPPPDMG
ncbi:hypothetical protein BD626DRAFT_633671 [Schizophyllum amplum]|uniref:Uncharacterized protein n=1 Tax=Schizophyllum amplum TaxID=97359 RepID=A0A550C278_9AGAR|nr:hypothetical protein BD626DRAFT_633671 [Auriculariopsis ampla]